MPLPDYLQRALGGPSTPSAPARPAPPARPSGLPAYMKRALGQPEEEEPFLPLLDQWAEDEAQQPFTAGSPVLAGMTTPAGALRTEDMPEESPTHPMARLGYALRDTWQDIGDRLSAGSAQSVGALGRTAREVGRGMGSGGAALEGFGTEVERLKGQEQETARRDIQQSASSDSLAGDVLEAAPGMVTTIGAGMLGGIPLATGVGGAQAFGGGMQEAEAGGASRDEALAYATTSAGAEMLTEQLGDVRLLRRVLEGVPENQLTTILRDMALGGAEEMAAETANSLARVMTYDDTQAPAEALAGDVDNILRSGLVGAILQGAGTGTAAIAVDDRSRTVEGMVKQGVRAVDGWQRRRRLNPRLLEGRYLTHGEGDPGIETQLMGDGGTAILTYRDRRGRPVAGAELHKDREGSWSLDYMSADKTQTSGRYGAGRLMQKIAKEYGDVAVGFASKDGRQAFDHAFESMADREWSPPDDDFWLPDGIPELRDASLAIGEPMEADLGIEEAMPHAGSDVSPEAINRVQLRERYVRITPGGEVIPIINDVGAVDVQVRPGEVKAVVGQDGSVRVEQGRANTAQQRALSALYQQKPGAAQVQDEAEPEVYDLTDDDPLADIRLDPAKYSTVHGRRYQATNDPQEFPPLRKAKYHVEFSDTNHPYDVDQFGLGEGGPHQYAYEFKPRNPLVVRGTYNAKPPFDKPAFELPIAVLSRVDPEFLQAYEVADREERIALLTGRGIPESEASELASRHWGVGLDRVMADWARSAGHDFIIGESPTEGVEIVQLYQDSKDVRQLSDDETTALRRRPVLSGSHPGQRITTGPLSGQTVKRGTRHYVMTAGQGGEVLGHALVEFDSEGSGYRLTGPEGDVESLGSMIRRDIADHLEDLTDYGTFNVNRPAAEEEVQAPPALPARLATRAGEEGFVQPRALARDIGKFLRRNFTVEGLLPARVFERKVLRDGRLAKHSERLRVLSTDLQKALRRYKGPLSTDQLTRYLDDAYRGMNLATGPELLDPTQIQRIATRRGVTAQSVEQAMLRARESKAGGLLQAPQFIPLIREMRVETEALTRQLRRQGLLTDGVARDLERKYGLYVHRQYEAVRNPKWQERIQERPLWNRAIELTTARWRRAVDQQRAALVKKEGISAQEAEQRIPYKTKEQILGLLDNYISKTGNRPVLPGGRPEGALDLSATFERDILDELARSLLGEVRDVRSNLVTTVTKLSTMVEQQAFLEDVARVGKGSFLFDEPVRLDDVSYSQQIDPGLYVKAFQQAKDKSQGPGIDRLQVQESKRRTDPLGELYTSQDILDELNKIYDSRSYQGFIRLYFGANVFVKAMKTIGSPFKSANRNLISNMSYCLLNGVMPGDPKAFGEAVAKSHGRTASWIPGSTNRARSARVQRYLELGLFDQGTDLGDIKAMESRAHVWRGEEKMQWANRPGEAMEFLGRWYNAPDNVAKAYVFEKLLPRYRRAFPALPAAEVEEYVAEILRDTMQNYGMVPRGIQELGQHTPVIAPFLSFWEEVLRNTKNAVKVAYQEASSDNPELRKIGRQRIAGLAAAASVPEIVSFAWKWLLNYDDEDEEAARRFMAPWNQNSQVMFLPPPDEGQVRFFDWGFVDPLAYLKNPVYRLLEGDLDGAMEALGSPFSEEILFKYLADIARNQKKEGGPVYNKYAPWLYKAEQVGGHLWKGLGPGSALDFQRIVQAHLDDTKAAWPEYLALAGPRIVTLDLGKGLTNNAFDFMTAISASDGSRKIYRDAVRGRGPIEDPEQAWRVTERQLTYSINEMIMDVEAARQHDLSDEQIEKSLAAARVPAWLIGGLLDGATYDIVQHYKDLDAGYAEEQEDGGS